MLTMGSPTVGVLLGNTTRYVLRIAPNDFPTVRFSSPKRECVRNRPRWQSMFTYRSQRRWTTWRTRTCSCRFRCTAARQWKAATTRLLGSTIRIPSGSKTGTAILLRTVNDSQEEADKAVTLEIGSTPTAWVGTPSRMKVTLKDDDPSVTFEQSAQSVIEGGGAEPIIVRLSHPTNKPVRVPIRSTGTASTYDFQMHSTSAVLGPIPPRHIPPVCPCRPTLYR